MLSQTHAISRQGTAKLLSTRHVLRPAKNAASHWENGGIKPWTLPREMPRRRCLEVLLKDKITRDIIENKGRAGMKRKSVLGKGWLHHLCQELMAASTLHFGQMADAYFLEWILSWRLHQWSSFAAFPLDSFEPWEVRVTLKAVGWLRRDAAKVLVDSDRAQVLPYGYWKSCGCNWGGEGWTSWSPRGFSNRCNGVPVQNDIAECGESL